MKKYFIITASFIILVVIVTFSLKWDQLKYYFRTDNTSFSVRLYDISKPKVVTVNDTLMFRYKIENRGSNVLRINDILNECDCIVVNKEVEEIPVGKNGFLDVVYYPTTTGEFKKHVLIEANTAPPFTVVTLEGEIQ